MGDPNPSSVEVEQLRGDGGDETGSEVFDGELDALTVWP